MTCDCPKDWVACFSVDCPRAAEIKKQQATQARDFLVSPIEQLRPSKKCMEALAEMERDQQKAAAFMHANPHLFLLD